VKPFVDDNRMFYLAADNDVDRGWVDELAADVWKNQLPAYRRWEESHAKREAPAAESESAEPRSVW
jgi:hypothetical protein